MENKNCTNCSFVLRMQTLDDNEKPIIGKYTFQCRRMPPTATIIPGPQGITNLTGFPAVNKEMFCAEWLDSDDPLALESGPRLLDG